MPETRHRSGSPAIDRADTFRPKRHPIGRAKGETKIPKRLREESMLKELGSNAFFLEELANGFFVEFFKTPHQAMQEIHCLLRFGTSKF